MLIFCAAIEYIRNTQHAERNLQQELQRLQRDSDYGREAQKENEMLKTEVQVMHQHLRRLDPNAPHIYGHFTSQLSQSQPQPQTNGGPNISLPPIHQTTAPNGHGPAGTFGSNAAMQGVEYGYAR